MSVGAAPRDGIRQATNLAGYLGMDRYVPRHITKKILDNLKSLLIPVRVYMNLATSRIWAHKEREDGTFDAAADLGLVHHDGRAVDDEGNLCLRGEDHVVIQTKFAHNVSRVSVQNIHTQVSKKINIFGLHTIMVTMNGHLLVFGFHQRHGQFYLTSFESPEHIMPLRGTTRLQVVVLPVRPILDRTPKFPAYGVLKIGGVQKLIVAGFFSGPNENDEAYCHLHVINCEQRKLKKKNNKIIKLQES